MKKIFSILLVIIFFLGILPTNVLADNANIFTNKAMLTVKAVPNFTSLRIYQRVGVTTTATGGTAPYMNANYVIKDGKIIYRGWYGTSNIFYYVPKTIGTYKITSFVRDVTGAIKYVTTVPIKVTDYTATQPLYVSTATNAAELSAGQNLIVRAVAYGGAGGYNYAFYVRREGTIIYKGNYSTNNIFSYILTDAGSYDVLCFVKDRLGEIVCRSTRQVSAIVAPNPKYRALIIGQHNYWDHTLAGTDVDANNMNTMLITKPSYGTMAKLTKKLDLTGRGILSTIPVAFAGADSSSVSVFYYSGHGSDNGYIFGVDNNYPGSGAVSSTELANA
ncbi:MAG: hypothetical protein GYA87_02265, partial [Christensenellaceae bacterium]|nr:hypothetical protein [Christensenellaceae bacterium]